MKHKVVLIILVCIFFNFINFKGVCQTVNKDTVYVYTQEKILLEYGRVLEQGAQEHRKYLENLYQSTIRTLTIIIILFLGILTFLGLRTFKSIKASIKDSSKKQVKSLFEDQVGDITKEYKNKLYQDYSEQLDTYKKYSSHFLVDLSSKTIMTKSDNPLPNIDYDNLKNRKILWVDDNMDNNKEHINVFENLGVQFTEAKNTLEAMDLIHQDTYNLIISNMGRPDKNGRENQEEGLNFLKELRQNDIKISVIIYTRPKNLTKYGAKIHQYTNASITQGYTGLFKEILRNLNESR